MADTADRPQERLIFRDPAQARALSDAIAQRMQQLGRPVTAMHVCGTHEQSIARFGLRANLPKELDIVMGPGCPVCVTDLPEVDEAIALARQGLRILTFADVLQVPGAAGSLAEARAAGARVDVVTGPAQAAQLAAQSQDDVVFFATGFETTAVATAAVLLADPPPQLTVLSAHKYIPPAMEVVVAMPGTRVEGFLAAGHAATITGYGVFEAFAQRHRVPVVVAGFEPLDILGALLRLVELIADGRSEVVNLFPRCVTRDGNQVALKQLWQVFEPASGRWRGIAQVPDGNLVLREAFARCDARRRFDCGPGPMPPRQAAEFADHCRCGEVLTGIVTPRDCSLFGRACRPDSPVGACMVSREGACRIWHEFGGRPELPQD